MKIVDDEKQLVWNNRLVILAGPNGSGKTSAYEHLKEDNYFDEGAPFVNADVYAEDLAKQCGFPNVNELPEELKAEIDLKAGRLALLMRAECFKRGIDFVVETTASSRGVLRLIEDARSHGYFVETHYIILNSPELSNLRILTRVHEGGHFVPPEIVERRYHKALELLPEVLAHSDSVLMLDNTIAYELVLTKDDEKIKLSPNCNWDEARLRELVERMRQVSV